MKKANEPLMHNKDFIQGFLYALPISIALWIIIIAVYKMIISWML